MSSVYDILANKGKSVWTIFENDTVYKGLQVMAEKDVGALVVTSTDGRPVGIFSERDYARKVVLLGKSSLHTSVGELMVTELHPVTKSHTIEDCMKIMTEKRTRYLPVIEATVLLGLISIGDVVNHLLTDQKFQIKELTQYITGSGASHVG